MNNPKKKEIQKLSVDEALHYAVHKPRLTGMWKSLLALFMLAYWLPVCFWLFRDMPSQMVNPTPSSPLKAALEAISMKCMIASGSTQHWSVFSPTLNHTIYHETAIITFRDGTNKIYEFPRMAKLSYFERFKHEKLRKIFGDCIPWPGYEQFLPSVARYLAQSNNDIANPPAMLIFEQNYNVNPKPDPNNWNYRDKLPWHTGKTITFVYTIRKNDLATSASGAVDLRRSNSRIYEESVEPKSQGGTI